MLLNNQVKQSPIIGLAGMGGGIASYVFLSAGGAYEIARSLRFNSTDSAYLSRTPASAGNRKTWTWAGWVKRSKLSSVQPVFYSEQDSSNLTVLRFSSNNTLHFYSLVGGNYAGQRLTSSVFRDTSAWYHITIIWDSTNATVANRMRLYVNGIEVTAFTASDDPNSADSFINSTYSHRIGTDDGGYYFDGYLADVWFIDGQALEPTAFGEFDADTGVWNPKRYTGAKSGNSFHLPFSDATSTTTLGYDDSGNNNNWTLNNFSVAAGAGNDSLLDSPSNDTDTGTGIGGEITGNYCTWNSLIITTNNTLSQGNLRAVHAASSWSGNIRGSNSSMFVGTFGVSSGKWYWEITMNDADNTVTGVVSSAMGHQYYVGYSNNLSAGFVTASLYQDSSWGTYQSMPTLANGDIVGVALDMDNGKLWFSKNGTFVNSGNPAAGTGSYTTGITGTLYPALSNIGSTGPADGEANFGQRTFAYTAPTGFKALNTAALPTPAIEVPSDYVGVTTYSGTGSTRSINVNLKPDLVWIKNRNGTAFNVLFDTVRGATKALSSNSTLDESSLTSATSLTAFTDNGFTVATDGSVNASASSQTYVAWCWKAGGNSNTFNIDGTGYATASAAGLTAGTITPTGASVGTTQGFSIITWTGTSASGTISHGLGKKPSLIIGRRRNGVANWCVYHISTGASQGLNLQSTDGAFANTTRFDGVEPTSTVFSVGSSGDINAGDALAYCFAPVAGYSAFGSYTNNGNADGPFVELGFRPALVIIKSNTDPSGGVNWTIQDSERSPYNYTYLNLSANSSGGDNGSSAYPLLDFLSNGFKVRNTFQDYNYTGATYTYVYAAWAESPFSTQARAR